MERKGAYLGGISKSINVRNVQCEHRFDMVNEKYRLDSSYKGEEVLRFVHYVFHCIRKYRHTLNTTKYAQCTKGL